jgi:glycosyltransferase involved in cell wall biosynthesis
MRVLYFSQYFLPEVGATQTRAYEMAQGLVRAGHQVTMIAEVPNHPSGIIPPEYRSKLYERVDLEGMDVIRVWVKTSPEKNFRSRMAFYLSYMVMAILSGLLLARGKYQVIYVTSPPLFAGAAAVIVSYLRRLPLVFEVRDLWPESAIALGEIRNPQAIRWATQLEEVCYRRARKVVVTTNEMVDYLVRRGFSPDKIVVIPNGANTDLFRFDSQLRQKNRAELGLVEKFVVGYAGLLGIAQGLEACLDAAARLGQRDPSVHFLFIGDGPVKLALQEKAEKEKITNVTFLPSQPRETIPGYLSASDIALVPLTRTRLLGALPSKMFDAMACQRPVLLGAEGEAQIVLEKAQAGIVVEPENVEAIVDAILHLKADTLRSYQMGLNGLKAVEANYSRQALAQKLVNLLEGII